MGREKEGERGGAGGEGFVRQEKGLTQNIPEGGATSRELVSPLVPLRTPIVSHRAIIRSHPHLVPISVLSQTFSRVRSMAGTASGSAPLPSSFFDPLPPAPPRMPVGSAISRGLDLEIPISKTEGEPWEPLAFLPMLAEAGEI
eukprot:scaffold26756_cov18-Tisochrysis_lutea.AAC.1